MRYPHYHRSSDTLEELSAIFDKYREQPLERHQILGCDGPSLFPNCVADLASLRKKPLREPLDALLSGPSPRDLTAETPSWQLELVAAVAVGDYADRSSQIWACKVRRGSEQEVLGEVIVKLYFKNWSGYQYLVDGKTASWWMDQDSVAETEARV